MSDDWPKGEEIREGGSLRAWADRLWGPGATESGLSRDDRADVGPNATDVISGPQNGDWRAEVLRLNPATDVLVAKVAHNITAQQAQHIKEAIRELVPALKVLVLSGGFEVAVIRRGRKTLVRAARRRR